MRALRLFVVTIASLALASACGEGDGRPAGGGVGASAGAAASSGGESASVDDNQQGHALAAGAGGEAPTEVGEVDTSAPMREATLWCQDPTGTACRQVAAALKISPVDASAIAPELAELEDLDDDCGATGMEPIRRRTERALGLSTGGWRDQVGDTLDRDAVPDMYLGSGCIHDSDEGRPVVKIHATRSAPRRYLVRVWENGTYDG